MTPEREKQERLLEGLHELIHSDMDRDKCTSLFGKDAILVVSVDSKNPPREGRVDVVLTVVDADLDLLLSQVTRERRSRHSHWESCSESETHDIIVNGTRWTINGVVLRRARVIELAFGVSYAEEQGHDKFSVVFTRGSSELPQGMLAPGETTKIVDEMVISVVDTTRT